MLELHAPDGAPIYISAALISAASPDISPEHTEVCAGNFTHIVRESPDEVARLVAEAQRPAAGVDLEAVAPEDLQAARTVLAMLAANVDYNWYSADVEMFKARLCDTLHPPGGDWHDVAVALRALAARLGGAS